MGTCPTVTVPALPPGREGVLVCLPLAQQTPSHKLPPGLEADLDCFQGFRCF